MSLRESVIGTKRSPAVVADEREGFLSAAEFAVQNRKITEDCEATFGLSI
jgi:hypothetical protein